MDRNAYTILPIDTTPQDIINEYHLMDKVKKMDSSCVKYDGECMEFHRQEWLQTNYSRRGLKRTDTAPAS